MKFEKVKKQVEGKPAKLARMMKHAHPEKKKFGKGARMCRQCGKRSGLIQKYGLLYCRQCFREEAERLGFKKYG